MLAPETMWMSVARAVARYPVISIPADCKGQGSYVCHGIDDCRLRVEKEGHRRVL